MELLYVTFHAVHELSIGGPKVGSAATGGDRGRSHCRPLKAGRESSRLKKRAGR